MRTLLSVRFKHRQQRFLPRRLPQMYRGALVKLESKYLILATVASFFVVLDQIVKIYVHANFSLGESVPVIHDLFAITYVRNTGAAFGIFREGHELLRSLFFLSMPPIAMLIIVMMLKRVENSDRWQVFSLSLIFGGALGNYIDRLRFGYVIDSRIKDGRWIYKLSMPDDDQGSDTFDCWFPEERLALTK